MTNKYDLNSTTWANDIDFDAIPESDHVADDIALLKTATEGTLVVSMSSGRVAPITETTKTHVKAFGIWFRRDNGEEKGRRNGYHQARRILALTNRSRDEVVFRHWPELVQEVVEEENASDPAAVMAQIKQCQTPPQRIEVILRECSRHCDEFVLKVQHIYGSPTLHITGYHIPRKDWVKFSNGDRIEFPDSAFHMACNATKCRINKRPVKQPGLDYHWFIAAESSGEHGYDPRDRSADVIERRQMGKRFEDALFFQSLES